MLAENVRQAARAIADRPLRAALTISGITIGIAALFSLLSIAEGIRSRIVDEWLSSGLMTSIAVMPEGSPNPLARGREGRRSRRSAGEGHEERRILDDQAAEEISRIEGVRRVWPILSRPVALLTPDREPTEGARREGPEAQPDTEPGVTADDQASSAGGSSAPGKPPARPAVSMSPGQRSSPAGTGSVTQAASPAAELATVEPSGGHPNARAGEDSSHPADGRGYDSPVPARADRTDPPSGPAAAGAPPDEKHEGHDDGDDDGTDRPAGEIFTSLRGLPPDFFWDGDYLRIVAGSPLGADGGAEAVLGKDQLKDLGFAEAADALGKTVVVRWRELAAPGTEKAEPVPGLPFFVAERTREFRIVGVFEKRGSLSLRMAGIVVPSAEALRIGTLDVGQIRSLFEGGRAAGGHSGLDVYTEPGADLEAIEKKIREMGFETVSGAEIVSRIRRSILVLQAVLGGLGSIAIAVATLGIANTLLTAVYERTREIGVMKAVGARRRDIRRQFFAEAGLIGFSGGVLGLIVGYGADHLLAFVIGEVVRRQGGDDPGAIAVHTPTIALGCLAFSVALSLLAGTWPAARAARLDPVETLRHE